MSRLHSIYSILVPAYSYLHRHGLIRIFNHGRNDVIYEIRIFKQCRTFPVFYYFRYGTSHIYIYGRTGKFSQFPCRKCHDLRLMAEDLKGHRSLLFISLKKPGRILIFVPQSFAAYHLAENQRSSLFPAQSPHRRVCYACKRRKKKGIIQCQAAYSQFSHGPPLHFYD